MHGGNKYRQYACSGSTEQISRQAVRPQTELAVTTHALSSACAMSESIIILLMDGSVYIEHDHEAAYHAL